MSEVFPKFRPEDDKGFIQEGVCPFVEYDDIGMNQEKCWFIPSPETCDLCLKGKLIDRITPLIMDLTKITERKLRS